MVSLFVLFSLFYKRSYSKKNKGSNSCESSKDIDQCHKAMSEISTAAKEAAGHAAKDAGKVLKSASKVVKKSAVGSTM